jgi:hypothetical protein
VDRENPPNQESGNPQVAAAVADMDYWIGLTLMPRHVHISHSSELSDEKLERYLMGHIQEEAELMQVEAHLIACPACARRAKAMADYIATMREALRELERKDSDLPH